MIHDETEELRELLQEQTESLEAAHAELVELRAIVAADDRLAQANARICQLTSEVRSLRDRNAGLMSECAAAKQAAQRLSNRVRQLQKSREAA